MPDPNFDLEVSDQYNGRTGSIGRTPSTDRADAALRIRLPYFTSGLNTGSDRAGGTLGMIRPPQPRGGALGPK